MKRCRQGGFTLIEVMIASAIGLLLTSSIYGIIVQTLNMSEVLIGQITINRNAREMFHMLQDGGVPTALANPVPGIRGYDMTVSLFDATLSRLQMTVGGSTIISSATSPTVITCTGANQPHPRCVVANTNVGMTGYLAALTADPKVAQTGLLSLGSTAGYPVVVPVWLMNPTIVGRSQVATADANSDLLDLHTMVVRTREAP